MMNFFNFKIVQHFLYFNDFEIDTINHQINPGDFEIVSFSKLSRDTIELS